LESQPEENTLFAKIGDTSSVKVDNTLFVMKKTRGMPFTQLKKKEEARCLT
jgi:hypothetical protein